MVDIRVSILVIVFITIITSNGIVTATSPCVYKGTFDGYKVTIDLSTIIDNFPITVKDISNKKFTYKIDLCKSVTCNNDFTSECGCQIGANKNSVPYHFSLGHLSTAKWTIKSLSPPEFVVKYTNGDISQNSDHKDTARSAEFHFQYGNVSKSDTTKMTKDDSNLLQYTFAITGNHVSIINGGKAGGSVIGYIGLVIIILILVAVIIYLIVGGVYMYKLRGARGVEVIPHLDYWTEVPLLVKDGCVFTFGPLVRKVRGGQSYEKI